MDPDRFFDFSRPDRDLNADQQVPGSTISLVFQFAGHRFWPGRQDVETPPWRTSGSSEGLILTDGRFFPVNPNG